MSNPEQGIREETTSVQRMQYPSMKGVLPPANFNIRDAVLPGWFAVKNCSVVVGLIVTDGKLVHLVHQSKEPTKSKRRVCPQETLEYVRDGTLYSAILRGLDEELGVSSRGLHVHPHELVRFENHLPLSRTGGVPTTKCIIYVGVRVPKGTVFKPNPKEIREVVPMTDTEYLQFGYATKRPDKCTFQTEAIVAMMDAGLLAPSQWGLFIPHLTQLRAARALH